MISVGQNVADLQIVEKTRGLVLPAATCSIPFIPGLAFITVTGSVTKHKPSLRTSTKMYYVINLRAKKR